MVFTTEQLSSIQIAVRIVATLSFLGSLGIIISFIYVTKYRKQPMNHLVFYLTISDLFGSAALACGNMFFTITPSRIGCIIQGAAVQYFLLTSLCWAAAISTQVMLTMLMMKPFVAIFDRNIKYYHIVCWLLPAFFTILPVIIQVTTPELGDVYTNATLWCWIGPNYAAYRMYLFYIPLWIIFVYCLTSYSAVSIKLVRHRRKTTKNGINAPFASAKSKATPLETKFVYKSLSFVLIVLICWIPGTTNRIQGLIDPANPIYVLTLIHSIMTPMQGLLNSFLYFFYQKIADKAAPTLSKWSSIEKKNADDSFFRKVVSIQKSQNNSRI